MGTYRLSVDVEKRLKEWAKGKYRDDAGRIAMEKFTFSDVISDLLQEAGF